MKPTFSHSASLLRAVLLLGALTFVNEQQTAEAQPVSITQDMPDAFETKEPVIGDGEYYYIQFYKEEIYSPYLYQSFIGEKGEGEQMQAMDYMPFAANRLWTLVSGSDATHFKLKSKRGFFVYYDNNRFYTTATETNATEFTMSNRGSYRPGFKELITTGNARLGRWSRSDWGGIINTGGYNEVNFVRFAKLKPNAAHIIYYREGEADNENPQASTIRHYLTYSGADNGVTASVIFNGDLNSNMQGGDVSCFFVGTPSSDSPQPATVTDGIGVDNSKGISITSAATGSPQEWDTQFFIRSKDVIPEGSTIHVEFDYRASAAVNGVQTQAHSEPGVYRQHGTFGSLNFTTGWQRYSRDITIPAGLGNDFRTIAINLYKNNAGVVYYFDNIVFTAPITTDVSSRRSIIPPDKSLWTLPTAAVYHQDGLWTLEETGSDGQFYIKKYGEEQYLTVRQTDTYNYCSVLDEKDEVYGKFNLETPTNSRYTRIHNNCPYWGLPRYLSYSNGDGSSVIQGVDNNDSWWYAGFYPVEVPVPNKDEFFQVRLVLNPPHGTQEDRQYIPLNPKQKEGITRKDLLKDGDNIIGATYTYNVNANGDWLNCFQYKDDNALSVPSGYQKIVVRFASPVAGNWAISGIVNGEQGWEQIPEGSLYYEMDLTGINTINDFTIFNMTNANSVKIEIAEIYFYKGAMINNENGAAMSSSEGFPSLWELEQVDDYTTFRLKNPTTGRYLAGNGQMTAPNDPTNAEVNPNSKFYTDFSLKWYIPEVKADKEIRIEHYVRHKESYLRPYAAAISNQEGLRKQGLARDIDSDWKNFTGDLDGMTQNTNHFEITHFVKRGTSKTIEFPTVLNLNNDHILYQRFYHYGETDTEMDLDNLKAHVSLDTRDDGDVQYFLYNNGMVTGQKLDWRTYSDGVYTDIPNGGMARNEQRRFNYINSDGQPFDVAVDVSRYSDLKYLSDPDHLAGDLREPSLTMRYIFHMNDAKDMAKRLTACSEGSGKWLETKEFHFGRTQVPYTKSKKVGYRGEFIPVRHLFSDYWVYDDPRLIDDSYLASLDLSEEALNEYLDQHLVSAVNNNDGGKIEVEVIPGNTGIRKGGYNPNINLRGYDDEGNDADYQGFYFYDKIARQQKTEYGSSRFIVFRYPASGIVENCGPANPAFINVYLNNGGTRYQLAQFTIYFDANMATRPWTQIDGLEYANGTHKVKNTVRDPNQLRARAGKPIAKITFDYPIGDTYHYPTAADCPHTDGKTRHDGGERDPGGTIANSSPVPLTFNHTNYSFDGNGANWGSYALVTQKETTWGNQKTILPADDATYGYNLPADPGMQKAFLYIDASEQPGDICAVDFEGEFCPSDQLMCTGWISGCNRYNDNGEHRCPGSITLTVKGEDVFGNTVTIYRFCPGQIYELDNGNAPNANGDATVAQDVAGVDGSGNGATHVVWQQFYFEFSVSQKYERYWLEVNNNCVSSNGGDFMLDNVEVYTIVPEVVPDINTPLCVSVNDQGEPVTDMRLLRLDVNYNKLKSSSNASSGTTKLGFLFLEKDVFLQTLWDRKNLGATYANLDSLAIAIKEAKYTLDGSDADYKAAFDAALLGNKTIWDSSAPTTNMGAGVMYFEWNTNFEAMPEYTFAKAVNKEGAVFRYNDEEGYPWLVFNGNYPGLKWKTNTEYYVVPTNNHVTDFSQVYDIFDICSQCSRASVIMIEPPYELVGLEKSEEANDYMVCEGQIPTLVTDLKGFDFNGVEVP